VRSKRLVVLSRAEVPVLLTLAVPTPLTGGEGSPGSPNLTTGTGPVRGRAWNVPSRAARRPVSSSGAAPSVSIAVASVVPRGALAAPLARAAALCRHAERARLS